MRAKYAEAIRYGILKGRQTRYGDVDDPYYKLRSDVIWGYGDYKLRELSLKAFEKSWETEKAKRTQNMSPEEYYQAKSNFAHAWVLWTESREEKQARLLREEVNALNKRVRALEET